MPEPVRYHVDLSDRVHHLVRVAVHLPSDVDDPRLVMASWTPGSYVIRNYARHVQWIRAQTPSGEDVTVLPDGLGAWRLGDGGAGAVVELELYANELTVRTNHVDDRHALLIPAATFPYVEGAGDRPHLVAMEAPDGERAWSLLPEDDADPGTFRAADLDHLIDSAFEVGDLPHVDYEVQGVPHGFVWAAPGVPPDLDRIGRDCAAIGEAAVELFGGDLPVERYTFLCEAWDAGGGGGGLEHRDGAVLQMPVLSFGDPDKYARLQALVAHEYLHMWNVKRLVPAALVAPNYTAPTQTTSLWVAEGWTDHYDDLLPLRAGVWTLKRFLEAQRDLIEDVTRVPGAAYQSVRQASYEAWIKLYHRDENWPNVGVNYYGHGALLAWCLDLLLRRGDPDGDGLDGVLRALWGDFGSKRRGYEEEDVEAAVANAAGRDLGSFFRDHVAGTELPPIEELLDAVGLQLREGDSDAPAPPDLGVRTTEDDRGVVFTHVLRDGPAWSSGLTGGDRLVAIDGTTVGRGELDAALRTREAGDSVELAVTRGPRLLELAVELGPPRPKRELAAVDAPSSSQETAFRRWTGRDLGEVGSKS